MTQLEREADMGLQAVLHKARTMIALGETSNREEFGFHWAGVRFHGRLEAAETGQVLTLAASLCRLPYRAENAPARARLAALVAAANNNAGVRSFSLSPQGDVRYGSATLLSGPLAAAGLAKALTVELLGLRPVLISLRAAIRQPQLS